MNFTLNNYLVLPPVFTLDIGPNLQQLGAHIVSSIEQISADLDAKLADLQGQGSQVQGVIIAALNTKHDQVMATIGDLQKQLADAAANTNATDPAQLQSLRDKMSTGFDQLKSDLQSKQDAVVAAIQNVDQAASAPPPTPPTPAPGPAPDQTGAPTPPAQPTP